MPLALALIAYILVITGIKGNYQALGTQFESDVLGNGSGGFLSFMIGIVGIAAFFRLLGLPNAGRVFLVLVILVFIMQNQNILTILESIGGTSSTAANTPGQTTTGTSPVTAPTSNTSAPGAAQTGETSGTGSST